MENNKKWYQKTPAIVACLIFFFPVGLFLMWKYASWTSRTKWIITGLLIAIILIGQAGNKNGSSQQESKAVQSPQPSVEAKPQYEKVNYENNPTVENFWYLYSGADKTKETIEKIAKEIKEKECKKPCNISIYDDKKAVDLDLEYQKTRDMAEATNWKEKNYVFVADHLLGFQEFGTDTFAYYPYKDWFYKEQVAKAELSQFKSKEGKYLTYNYSILYKKDQSQYAATFTPFLPKNDSIILGTMAEMVNQAYGKNLGKNPTPKIVERNGTNLIVLEGGQKDYYFLVFKEDTGEAHSFYFWEE